MKKYANLNAYLFMALYDMIVDLEHTPQILINIIDQSDKRPLLVPEEYAEAGILKLNIGTNQVEEFHVDYSEGIIFFNDTFAGEPQSLTIPVEYIIAVCAKENMKIGNMLANDLIFFNDEGMHVNIESTEELSLTRVVKSKEEISHNVVLPFKKPKLTIVK